MFNQRSCAVYEPYVFLMSASLIIYNTSDLPLPSFMTREGEFPYEEYMLVCHELGSYFQEKNYEKGMSIFHKLGSVILMERMTKRMKTELTDYFHLVWTKNPQF